MRSYFIVPVHNKENLIKQVLDGIFNSISIDNDYKIIVIIDGCTDNSESIVKDFNNDNIVILYQDDVHEITCLNVGLEYIKNTFNPNPDDLIFTVQDDVIIEEENIDEIFYNLFEAYPFLGYVSMRLGCDVVKTGQTMMEYNLFESEFGHWKQTGGMNYTPVKYNELIIKEIAIRSPTCMMWRRYEEAGFYDSNLAPCGYDCHDMSIRMNILGYKNAVYAMKYKSDVNWGTMRTNTTSSVNSKFGDIYERNRQYLVNKHKQYFEEKR
jgi:glycosyltransferase involved in cell wall biosynthesis